MQVHACDDCKALNTKEPLFVVTVLRRSKDPNSYGREDDPVVGVSCSKVLSFIGPPMNSQHPGPPKFDAQSARPSACWTCSSSWAVARSEPRSSKPWRCRHGMARGANCLHLRRSHHHHHPDRECPVLLRKRDSNQPGTIPRHLALPQEAFRRAGVAKIRKSRASSRVRASRGSLEHFLAGSEGQNGLLRAPPSYCCTGGRGSGGFPDPRTGPYRPCGG